MKRYSVTDISAKPKLVLSEAVYFYMLSIVPEGMLTRRADIEKYLAEKFEVDFIEFERAVNLDNNYWYNLIDKTPFHREVSAYGYTNEVNYIQLSKEGFSFDISKTMTGKSKIKVKEYKKHLIDFCRNVQINIDVIKRINDEKNF